VSRARTPTLLSMNAQESGPVALGMVLGYHDCYATVEELRTACGVGRDKCTPEKLLAAAASYGLECETHKGKFEDFKTLTFPMITILQKGHFVALEGYRKNNVYINDPDRGPQQLPVDVFQSIFSGVVFELKPGPQFKRGGQRPSFIRSLHHRLSGSGSALVFVLLASLGLVIPELSLSLFAKVFVDEVLVQGSRHWLPIVLLGMASIGAIQAFLIYLRGSQLNRLAVKVGVISTGRFFEHLLHLPMDYYNQRDPGDLSGRVGMNDMVARLLSGQVATALVSGLMGVFLILLMWRFDPELTLVTVFLSLFNFIVLRQMQRSQAVKNQKLVGAKYAVYGQSYSGLKSLQSLKASASESDFLSTWSSTLVRLINARQNLNFSTNLLSAMPVTVASLSVIAVMGLGGLRVFEGRMSVGDLVAFSALSASFAAPINHFVNFWQKIQQAVAQMTRLDEVLENPTDPNTEPRLEKTNTRLKGYLELKNVSFAYELHSPPLIQDLSLKLNPGQQIALVGSTGSGKSTVGKLICGLFQPVSGEILFDGKPRSEWSRATMNSSVARVEQQTHLFRGTIFQNISFWDEDIPAELLIKAAKDSDIHETIVRRPNGYDGEVYEDGTNFSGGQKQRLELARALALEPSVLVLDEATSALDTQVEAQVVENLRRRGCACIVIAHRLSTIRDCDEIIVLDHGRVVERGTHSELMDKNGAYRNLVESE
jgi:NHLM bacteriocin system ABC transporter peptidase/ATP-binding protein